MKNLKVTTALPSICKESWGKELKGNQNASELLFLKVQILDKIPKKDDLKNGQNWTDIFSKRKCRLPIGKWKDIQHY